LACGKQPIERIVPGELGKVADARGVFGHDGQQNQPVLSERTANLFGMTTLPSTDLIVSSHTVSTET
jgi:hypothetical protein